MPDYIEREMMLECIREHKRNTCSWGMSHRHIENIVKMLPPADAATVKHGMWIQGGYVCGETGWKCSVCGETEWRTSCSRLNYCPFCGAKMDGGAQNADN